MKKKIVSILFALFSFVALAVLAPSADAQTLLTTTTLSAAISSSATTHIVVASASGITAGSTVLYIADSGSTGEAVFVNAVNGTTLTVQRGYQTLGSAAPHASGTVVFVGPAIAFSVTVQPTGSCSRTSIGINNNYLPVIAFGLVGQPTTINDCVGGQWVSSLSSLNANTFTAAQVTPCSTAYTSCGTNTAIAAATSMYCSEIDVRASKYVTGLGVLNGATVGTDKHLVILYDGTGNLIANSATAGATTSGASTWQKYAFTTPYYVVGPAKYYACAQSNGTTDKLQMLTTGQGDNTTTKAVTGQVFGTIASTFTVPTTFTTVVGPYWELY
ncbi:MAG TPA: hypothetical protein VGG46_04045 [Terriglobales bacterium]